MNLKRLETRVMKDEGFRGKAYVDTVGKWTVGYGTTRWLGRDVRPGDAVTPEDARRLLRADLYGAILDAQDLFSRFDELNPVRQEVLANMAYNLGAEGLSKFQKMRKAADKLDYDEMAAQMADSKWFKQVGGRGQRLRAAMRKGDWIA